MLMPKKVKFRKQQRGHLRGKAWKGSTLEFGDYGLKTLDAAWITDRQIEAGRIAISRSVKKACRTGASAVTPGALVPALVAQVQAFGHIGERAPVDLLPVRGICLAV